MEEEARAREALLAGASGGGKGSQYQGIGTSARQAAPGRGGPQDVRAGPSGGARGGPMGGRPQTGLGKKAPGTPTAAGTNAASGSPNADEWTTVGAGGRAGGRGGAPTGAAGGRDESPAPEAGSAAGAPSTPTAAAAPASAEAEALKSVVLAGDALAKRVSAILDEYAGIHDDAELARSINEIKGSAGYGKALVLSGLSHGVIGKDGYRSGVASAVSALLEKGLLNAEDVVSGAAAFMNSYPDTATDAPKIGEYTAMVSSDACV